MHTTMRTCLFGGALFAAGIARADDQFGFFNGGSGGYAAVVDACTANTGATCDTEFGYAPNAAPLSAAAGWTCGPTSRVDATSDVTSTYLEVRVDSDSCAHIHAALFAFIDIQSPTDVRCSWDSSYAYSGSFDFQVFTEDYSSTAFAWYLYNDGIIESTGSELVTLEPGRYIVTMHAATNAGVIGGMYARIEIESASCFADCDGNGDTAPDDIDCFVTAFLDGDLSAADCDSNGALGPDDIDCFVTGFLSGCG